MNTYIITLIVNGYESIIEYYELSRALKVYEYHLSLGNQATIHIIQD